LCFVVLVQFAASVLHALDVEPHAEDPFVFRGSLFVAGPVVPGGHVFAEIVEAFVPAGVVVGFAVPLFPTGDFLQSVLVGGGEGSPVVVLSPAEEPDRQGPLPFRG
jgi:hypothetical protein